MKHEDEKAWDALESFTSLAREAVPFGDGYRVDMLHTAIACALDELAALRESGRCATAAACDVLAERRRQTEVEGWTVEHDDEHATGDLALAARAYCGSSVRWGAGQSPLRAPMSWPWEDAAYKPKGQRADLVRAGALILAEIERLDRLPLPEAPR